MAQQYIPKGYHTINPYLVVEGAAKLIEFLKAAFDGHEEMRFDGPEGVAHAAIRIGDSVVELGDATPDWKAMPASLHLYVPDADATYQRALQAGATSVREPTDMFYGERSAAVRDMVGNQWFIATLIEELSIEEMHRRAAETQSGEAASG